MSYENAPKIAIAGVADAIGDLLDRVDIAGLDKMQSKMLSSVALAKSSGDPVSIMLGNLIELDYWVAVALNE